MPSGDKAEDERRQAIVDDIVAYEKSARDQKVYQMRQRGSADPFWGPDRDIVYCLAKWFKEAALRHDKGEGIKRFFDEKVLDADEPEVEAASFACREFLRLTLEENLPIRAVVKKSGILDVEQKALFVFLGELSFLLLVRFYTMVRVCGSKDYVEDILEGGG